MKILRKLAIGGVGVVMAMSMVASVATTTPAGASASKKKATVVKWVHGHPDVKGQTLVISNIGGPALTQIDTYWTNKELSSWGVHVSFSWSSSTSVGTASLVSGRTNVLEGSLPNVLPGVENGLNAKAIALAGPRLTYAFVSRAPVKSISNLKGHTIAAGNCTPHELIYPLGKQALQSVGLSEKTISCAALGDQSNRIAGILSGRVTASVLGHAALIKLAKTGVHNLYTFTKKDPKLYTTVVWALPSWTNSHPALAEAVAAAFMDFYHWFDNPKNSSAAVNMAVKTTPGATASTARSLFSVYQKVQLFPKSAALSLAAMKYQNRLYQSVGVLDANDPVTSFTTVKYSNVAYKKLK